MTDEKTMEFIRAVKQLDEKSQAGVLVMLEGLKMLAENKKTAN